MVTVNLKLLNLKTDVKSVEDLEVTLEDLKCVEFALEKQL